MDVVATPQTKPSVTADTVTLEEAIAAALCRGREIIEANRQLIAEIETTITNRRKHDER